MASGMFVTHALLPPSAPAGGFPQKAARLYAAAPLRTPLRRVSSAIFGGQTPHIDCVAQLYLRALHATLTDGYMDTDEDVCAILLARFPSLFSDFDNDSRSPGDRCASMQANMEEERLIAAGAAARFVSPAAAT